MHILCTICSDLVNQAENIFATKCGHIFHYHCLAQWIERSKSCPQCRNIVTDKCMFRIYPTISNETSGEDVTRLQSRLDNAQLQLRQQKVNVKEKEDKLTSINSELQKNEEILKSLEKKFISREFAISALKEQLDYVKIQNKETQRIKEENKTLKKNMQTLNGALYETESKKNEIRDRLQAAEQQIEVEKNKFADLQAKMLLQEQTSLQRELPAPVTLTCESAIALLSSINHHFFERNDPT